MTMPKGWKTPNQDRRSLDSQENQSTKQFKEEPVYRNPIPPGYMPSSPPPSRVTWPSRTRTSNEKHEGSSGFIIAIVIIAAVVILIASVFAGPYTLILIPIIVIGLVRGLKRGSGMNQYHDNLGRRGHRGK